MGHFVPDGGQLGFGLSGVSLEPRARSHRARAGACPSRRIQQIRADQGRQHCVGLLDGIAPGGRVDAGRHDLLERVDGGNDVGYAVGNSLAIACSPALEGQVQSAPGRAAPRARRRSRIAGRNGLALFCRSCAPGSLFPWAPPKSSNLSLRDGWRYPLCWPLCVGGMFTFQMRVGRESPVSVRLTPHFHSTQLGRECPSSYRGVGGRSARRPLGARQPRLLALIVRTVVEEELAPIAQCIRCSAPLLC